MSSQGFFFADANGNVIDKKPVCHCQTVLTMICDFDGIAGKYQNKAKYRLRKIKYCVSEDLKFQTKHYNF
jgi:hypothetical protein